MDKELESVIALSAELAQVKAERDQLAEEVKHNVLNWGRVEANERLCRDLAAGLRILQIIIRASGGGLVGYNGRTAHEWAREFDALLSRPEVVKLLEEENVFDDDVIRGAGEVRRRAESAERLCRELAVGLNSLLADQRVHLPVVPGSAGVRCLCYRCNALALLSRPEVVKLLEEKS